ncbi:helix-turn-helix domain-containing protein [Cellulomonas fimi]|uniref:helix-turn-helix domain-containing protein n=1 Tax=Cellulomonas fimi TaxID=1708 RepID=UPI00235A3BE2|nr:helix-turn-helix domain-containing protein [Cellulomonas fimi]
MTNVSAIFRSDTQARVLRVLARASVPMTATDVARELGEPLSTVAREVSRLVDAEMVRTERRGRRTLLTPSWANGYMRAAREAFDYEDARRAQDAGPRWWRTVPEIVDDVSAEVGRGDEPAAIRMLVDGLDALPRVAATGGADEMLAEPRSTGDDRWDALVAGSVRYVARRAGVPAPAWTRRRPLSAWWWPTGRGARAAVAVQHTPVELARLGVWFDERNFTTA